MQDEAEKKQIRNLCARLLKVGFPQQTTEAPNHNPHTIPLQHYATVSLQHFKGCTVYLITLTNILHLQRRISCSYSNWGLEWIFHTVRVAFHKETVTSPCSLTGYHHSNVPCTSECISMRTAALQLLQRQTLTCTLLKCMSKNMHKLVQYGGTAEILHPVPYTDLLQRRVRLMAYSNWATVDMHNLIAFFILQSDWCRPHCSGRTKVEWSATRTSPNLLWIGTWYKTTYIYIYIYI